MRAMPPIFEQKPPSAVSQTVEPKNVNEKFYFAEISANFLG